jgi:hypothetical protein
MNLLYLKLVNFNLIIGYGLTDPHDFATKMERVLKYNLNLDRYAKSEPLDIKIDDEEPKKETTTDDEKVDEPEHIVGESEKAEVPEKQEKPEHTDEL